MTCNDPVKSAAIAAIMFASLFLLLCVQLWDIDLWWHIATGKQILAQHAFLHDDPFGYKTQGAISPDRLFILNYSWLGQVIFFVVHQLAGPYGMIALRAAVLAALPTLVLLHCSNRRVPWFHSLPFAILGGWLTLHFTGERPQLFSFLFVLLLLLLLEDSGFARKGESGSYRVARLVPIPLIMLLWANMHPGFILGSVLIVLYLTGEGAKLFLLRYPYNRRSFLRIATVLGASLAATLANPNGIAPYVNIITFEGTRLQQISSEYLSPMTLLLKGTTPLYPYWLYLALAVVVLIVRRRHIDLTHWLIVGFLMTISLQSFRYVPFFVLGTAPFLASQANAMLGSRIPQRLLQITVGAMVLMLLVAGLISGMPQLRQTMTSPIAPSRFPTRAVSFIRETRPSGKIFNHFNWGGYLIWELYPDYQVFIDGRTLSKEAFDEYTRILWDEGKGKELLNRNGINMVIIPGVHYLTGELYALADFLYRDPEWHLVYADETALVLLRGEANRRIVERRSLPKSAIFDHVIARANQLKASGVNTPDLWMALSTAYQHKGLLAEAMHARQMAHSLK